MSLFVSKAEKDAIERCRQRKIENELLRSEIEDLRAQIEKLKRIINETPPGSTVITSPTDERHYGRIADAVIADLKIQHPEWFDMSLLGVGTLSCPCCGKELQKYPQRKIACPHCGESIYPRKRPQDGVRVIIRECDLETYKLQHSYLCTGLWLRQVDASIRQLEECKEYDGYWIFTSYGWLPEMHNARVVCGSDEEVECLKAIFAPGCHAFVSYPSGHFDRVLNREDLEEMQQPFVVRF